MPKLKLSVRVNKPFVAATILGGSLLLALAVPRVNSNFNSTAQELMRQGSSLERSDSQAAAVKYRLAGLLQPRNREVVTKLTDAHLRLDQIDAAITAQKRLPFNESGLRVGEIQFNAGWFEQALTTANRLVEVKGKPEYFTLKSRSLLELDRVGEATAAAEEAVAHGIKDSGAQLQLGLCYAVGDKTKELGQLKASLSPPELVKALTLAGSTKLALAETLYARGLLRSSGRILAGLQVQTAESYLLAAKIEMAFGNYSQATQLLSDLIKLDPAHLEARKLRKEAYSKLKDTAGESREAEFIRRLETGQI